MYCKEEDLRDLISYSELSQPDLTSQAKDVDVINTKSCNLNWLSVLFLINK